jgi:predicted DNA binding CopG/RHH family protein
METIDSTTKYLRSKYRQTTGFDKFDDRRDFFLWVKVYNAEIKNLKFDQRSHILKPTILRHRNLRQINRMMTPFPTKVQLLEDICYKLDRYPTIKNQLTNLIPLQEIAWISNSKRQMEFIRKLIRLEKGDFLQAENLLTGLSDNQRSIISIDLLNISHHDKIYLVRYIKDQWRSFSQPNKDLSWFKADLEKKCSALNYHIQKSANRKFFRHPPICDLEDIEIFYDSLLLDNEIHLLQDLHEKTKRRYQKQKFNDQHSDKKQYNVVLPTELIKKLDKKASKRNIKRSQLIFEILNEAT